VTTIINIIIIIIINTIISFLIILCKRVNTSFLLSIMLHDIIKNFQVRAIYLTNYFIYAIQKLTTYT